MPEHFTDNNTGQQYLFAGSRSKASKSLIDRLTLSQVLNSHTGCVNTVCWSDDGQYILSGSDDTHLGLWSYSPGPSFSATSPSPTTLLARIPTRHRANIFSAKFMPGTSSSIAVCCAGDGDVRVLDLFLGDGRERGTIRAVYGCHKDRVKRVLPVDSNVFLTCAEDGSVRQFDLRVPHLCSPDQPCSPPLVNFAPYHVSLNSISIDPINLNRFVVAGDNPYLYMHDRRFPTNCIRRFAPSGQVQAHEHVTAAKFADSAQELIGSWSGGDVCLFDVEGVEYQGWKGNAVRNGSGRGRMKDHGSHLDKEGQRETSNALEKDQPGTDEDDDEDNAVSLLPPETIKSLEARIRTGFANSDIPSVIQSATSLVKDYNLRASLNSPIGRKTRTAERASLYRQRAKAWILYTINKMQTSQRPRKRKRAPTNGEEDSQTEPGASDALTLDLDSMTDVECLQHAARDMTRFLILTHAIPSHHIFRAVSQWGLAVLADSTDQRIERAREALKELQGVQEGNGFRECVQGVESCMGAQFDTQDWIRWCEKWITGSDDNDDSERKRPPESSEHSQAGSSDGDVDSIWTSDEEPTTLITTHTHVAYPAVPIITPSKTYKGHANIQTVKDATFLSSDKYIASGSDDGTLFIWDKQTTRIVQILRADAEVVNVIAQHPFMPVLGVSGIDQTVKIFEPVYPADGLPSTLAVPTEEKFVPFSHFMTRGPMDTIPPSSSLLASIDQVIRDNEQRKREMGGVVSFRMVAEALAELRGEGGDVECCIM
ncbi:hypothetical protein SpCBS45565_g01919 [Spizellomyces sp. 'palustris']|nr:hypothetical protein SpCBS45565_g01919 [Spizellomyces sp. 'palustris']